MNERVCKRRLRDAQQNRHAGGRLAAIGNQLVVFRIKFHMVNLFANQQSGFAGIGDFNLLQHLAHDHFNVLVVDAHTLQAVDFLDFIDKEGSKLFHALDRQNVMRCRIAIEQVFALLDEVAFLHRQMLALRNEVFHRFQSCHPAAQCGCGACSCSRVQTRPGRRFQR